MHWVHSNCLRAWGGIRFGNWPLRLRIPSADLGFEAEKLKYVHSLGGILKDKRLQSEKFHEIGHWELQSLW